jgi:hypothetical protein
MITSNHDLEGGVATNREKNLDNCMWAYHVGVGPWGARAKPAAPAHHWTKGHGHGVVRTGTGPAVAAFPNLGKIRSRTHQFFFFFLRKS